MTSNENNVGSNMCPNCLSTNVNQTSRREARGTSRRYWCNNCSTGGVATEPLKMVADPTCITCGSKHVAQSMKDVNAWWCRECEAMFDEFARGDDVVFTANVERYPHTVILKGSIGIVSSIDNDDIWIELSHKDPGLDEWDNKVQWSTEADNRRFLRFQVRHLL